MKREITTVVYPLNVLPPARITIPMPETLSEMFGVFENAEVLMGFVEKALMGTVMSRVRQKMAEEWTNHLPPIQEIRVVERVKEGMVVYSTEVLWDEEG